MSQEPSPQSRRNFIKTSGAAVVATSLAAGAVRTAHAAGSDVIRVGLIGCGQRGTGAVVDALRADKNAQLVAIGDAFEDAIRAKRLPFLREHEQVGSQIHVDDDHIFRGFDAYRQVIDSDVDVVLLTTSPHFRPQHLAYAVEKGKHVFCEKPVAVDGPGVRSVLETCRIAKQKNLSVVSGLCYRYHFPKRAVMDQIHSGAIGDIVALHTAYNTGTLWYKNPESSWSEMENQMRNWIYYNWLSGDFINEQHIHSLDKMAWAMNDEYPVKVSSIGGRQQRTDPIYGNVYDHFTSVYSYAGGQKCFSTCRQQAKCDFDVNDYVMGTTGTMDVMKARIQGKGKWRFKGKKGNMYLTEHQELFAGLRAGNIINNGDYMAKSTLMAIMARDSAYTGQDVTWNEAMTSEKVLGPDKYEWGDVLTEPVAIPGVVA